MNIRNIQLNIIYKNLKELCSILELEYKDSTNSRKSILKNIEQYMELERQGNKYIVKKVYDRPILRTDDRGKTKGSRSNNSVYVKYIDILVKGTLLNRFEDKNTIYTSTTAILESINLTESTFIEELNKVDEDSYINIKLKLLSTLNNMITSSLKRLERQSYIKLKESYVIIEKDDTRLATREETVIIDSIREQLIKELDIQTVQLLLNKNIRYEYYFKLKVRVVEQIYSLKRTQTLYRGFKVQENSKALESINKDEIEANRQQLIDLIRQRVFKL